MSASKASKTTVGICATVDGVYTPIGRLFGDIPLPLQTWAVEKHKPNDQTTPDLLVDDPTVDDIDLTIGYSTHAAHAALAAFGGSKVYVKFTLQNGDWFTYYAAVSKIGPVTGAEAGGCVGTVGFVFANFVASGDAEAAS